MKKTTIHTVNEFLKNCVLLRFLLLAVMQIMFAGRKKYLVWVLLSWKPNGKDLAPLRLLLRIRMVLRLEKIL